MVRWSFEGRSWAERKEVGYDFYDGVFVLYLIPSRLRESALE